MSDTHGLLARQAEWQKGRKALSWPEKIRMAERIRESVSRLRRAPRMGAVGPPPSDSSRSPDDPNAPAS